MADEKHSSRFWNFIAVLSIPIVVAAAGLPVYVYPQTDPVDVADAIVVLGGPEDGREAYAAGLAEAGWAPVLVYSNPYGKRAYGMTEKCKAQLTYEVVCFSPDPATTRGEARSLAKLAASKQWQTVVIVTYRAHIARARYILGQCFDGTLLMAVNDADQSAFDWAKSYVYQSAGFIKAFAQADC